MEEKKPRIATVVVTYNRKELLKNCLEAIETQEFKPECVFVINNASTDGTKEFLENLDTNLNLRVINLERNEGGAGGFYRGLKDAFEEKKYDAYWVMDDDGVPDRNCLLLLKEYLEKYDYLSPLVLDIENHNLLSFPYKGIYEKNRIISDYGKIIQDNANPFNGVIFSNRMVSLIGFPKREMFIWGDEVEYQSRARKFGIKPVTITEAIHYHPKDRVKFEKDFRGVKCIIYPDSDFRKYCKYRNSAYERFRYKSFPKFVFHLFQYSFFFIFQKRNIGDWKLYIHAIKDGIKGDFTHTSEYM